eukprot:COSAG02_NODE_4215_length_5621_cov_3.231800_5_plen_34_part_00
MVAPELRKSLKRVSKQNAMAVNLGGRVHQGSER